MAPAAAARPSSQPPSQHTLPLPRSPAPPAAAAAPPPRAQPFYQDGVTLYGTRYFSLVYNIKAAGVSCGYKDGGAFCWMAEAADDIPAALPAYRAYDPAAQGCQDAQPPGARAHAPAAALIS